MIVHVLKNLGYTYLEAKRKRTTDRYVLCENKEGFFYIKVDERQLEGYSNKDDIMYIYRSMIKKQIKDVKMFKTLVEVREYVNNL